MSQFLTIEPIAHIQTDFPTKFGIPRQSGVVSELKGTIVFENEYRDINAFREIESYSHLWLIWEFSAHSKRGWSASVRPPKLGGNKRVGVFATRSPFRPNPLGLSCVKLEKFEIDNKYGPVLHVLGADMLNGTPIYDIKPYVPYTDSHPDALCGFSVNTENARKKVLLSSELSNKIPQQYKNLIVELLSQDPHPSYKTQPDRLYHMPFADLEITFKTVDDYIEVVAIDKVL